VRFEGIWRALMITTPALRVRRHHGAASSGRPEHRHDRRDRHRQYQSGGAGATVTLTNESTASARTTVSGERGDFAFRAVDAGSYTVRVELAGFRNHRAAQ
jgi:hypothetical protein